MAVLSNPTGPLPLSGKPATKNEIKYARWADKTPHIVGGATSSRWRKGFVYRCKRENSSETDLNETLRSDKVSLN
jgi:hypothetical protein